MECIDLHLHTTASDGTLTPTELVKMAKSKGLKAIAITDHDTCLGIEEALEEGKRSGIRVIPGVEISVDFGKEMHILGYFSECNYPRITKVVEKFKDARNERNPKIIKKLNELGMDVTLHEVENIAKGEIVARPHMARLLIEKGYVKTMAEAFDKYLDQKGLAYVKREKLLPKDGIQAIKKAGGIPVLAHPVHLGMTYSDLDKFLPELIEYGLEGIEAVYVDNTDIDTGNYLRIATKHDLIVTGGSDFHGSNKSDIEIGTGRGRLKISAKYLDDLDSLLLEKD